MHKPINLVDINYNWKHELICQIPETYGIYILHRRYAEFGEALYIGKTSNLKRRISQELNAKELIDHIKEVKKVAKLVLC
ncbi:GIY-YIG nuclease family protein [Pectobacterium sp. FL60-S17]|uniref:GIY-YIG nuclease family protein n=1 Tax=Pectobacterium quasiaquaticum TaxID=2774015 RepID=A0A9Q2IDL4_9GAMM|nr:GIY-YIG nuclease family protein [Pectobacterium quasiaquaticum]MBE5210618.1 GIY-YIG nuclease family protein [Pectobacterium quasiaquaticum]MBE5221314.1 GIY-YIG nuclease family protein [Pectobacterium quasiaquaticum]URG50253.1 GIY-YIG nuclease family protein [Pectobacterium quasiaquaticum]